MVLPVSSSAELVSSAREMAENILKIEDGKERAKGIFNLVDFVIRRIESVTEEGVANGLMSVVYDRLDQIRPHIEDEYKLASLAHFCACVDRSLQEKAINDGANNARPADYEDQDNDEQWPNYDQVNDEQNEVIEGNNE